MSTDTAAPALSVAETLYRQPAPFPIRGIENGDGSVNEVVEIDLGEALIRTDAVVARAGEKGRGVPRGPSLADWLVSEYDRETYDCDGIDEFRADHTRYDAWFAEVLLPAVRRVDPVVAAAAEAAHPHWDGSALDLVELAEIVTRLCGDEPESAAAVARVATRFRDVWWVTRHNVTHRVPQWIYYLCFEDPEIEDLDELHAIARRREVALGLAPTWRLSLNEFLDAVYALTNPS